jgi:hypothetical protein
MTILIVVYGGIRMAHYLVKARPPENLAALRTEIDSGGIRAMQPFGSELHQCLLNARITPDGWAMWEENCYCTPPLKQERSVLDRYFTDLVTETIHKGEGWTKLNDLPSMWD